MQHNIGVGSIWLAGEVTAAVKCAAAFDGMPGLWPDHDCLSWEQLPVGLRVRRMNRRGDISSKGARGKGPGRVGEMRANIFRGMSATGGGNPDLALNPLPRQFP